MAQVVITVNGHSYTMQCSDGQEDHLRDLGQVLDTEVANIKASVGQVGDIRLLLMAGLVIADRLSETLEKVEALEDQLHGMRQVRAMSTRQVNTVSQDLTGRVDAAAKRIEALAREIAQ